MNRMQYFIFEFLPKGVEPTSNVYKLVSYLDRCGVTNPKPVVEEPVVGPELPKEQLTKFSSTPLTVQRDLGMRVR